MLHFPEYTMKIRHLITSSIALIALTASVRAQTPFVRASGDIAISTKGNLDTGAGVNLSAGYILGSGQNHELSLSLGTIIWAETDVDSRRYNESRNTTTVRIGHQYFEIPNDGKVALSDGKLKLSDGTTYNTDYQPAIDVFPVMANYRCYLGDVNGRVRFYLGGGVGYANVRARSELWQSGNSFHHHHDEETNSHWGFAWNGTAGVTVNLTRSLKLDFSYAYQEIDGGTFESTHMIYKLDSIKTSMLRGGVSWQF